MPIRLRMSEKEVMEGCRARIPEEIIGKMIQGYELSENEREIVKSRGKVYVIGYTKERGQIRIKPQLRNLSGKEKRIKIIHREYVSEEGDECLEIETNTQKLAEEIDEHEPGRWELVDKKTVVYCAPEDVFDDFLYDYSPRWLYEELHKKKYREHPLEKEYLIPR